MLRLTTLGAIDLRDRLGRPVREVLSQPKRIALLIHLVLEGRRGPVARDRLCAMFWPESDETRARNALSQAVYHLRQSIGPDLLVGQGPTLELAADQVWCDALVLEEAIARDEVELALDIHKGEFCPGLLVSGAAAFEEWVSETQRDQRRRLLALARRGVQRAAAAGDTAGAARVARRALTLFPDDERDVREYLTLIDAAGDGTGALALYAEYARRLAAELETDPSPETRTLVERIRQRRTAATASRAGVETRTETPPTDAVTPSSTPAVPAAASAHTTSTARTADSAAHSARTVRRSFLVAAALLLLLIWGVSGRARLGVAADRISRPSGPSAVAVFPFTVRGGEPENELSDGLAVLLAAKLDGTDEVRAIDPRSATNAAEGRSPDPARGDALSRGLGARYYVLGDLIERAGRLQMDGAIFATGRPGRAIATASVSGDTAELFTLVDDLAGRLLSTMIPGRDSTLTKLAAVTTASLPALKAYLRGERAMREGQDARAAAAFREAAMLDTSFALAQYRLALVANWVAVPGVDDPVIWAQAAARHDQRLTPLGRDLVEAFLAYKLPSSTAAARYRAIVQAYPDNVEAWYMYGEALFHYGPIVGSGARDARPAFERVLALDPTNSHALVHLARIAALEGRVDELASIAARHSARYAEAERTIETRALLAWARHDSVASRTILAEAHTADPVVVYGLTQAAALYSGNLADATELARLLADRGSLSLIRPYGRIMLAETSLGAGRWDDAAPDELRTAADTQWRLESEVLLAVEPVVGTPRERLLALRARVDASRPFLGIGVPSRALSGVRGRTAGEAMRLHLLGLLDLRLGERAGARARLDSLVSLASRADSLVATAHVVPLTISLRAEILRSEGRHAEALAELERFSLEFLPDRLAHYGVRERFARGELLVALGRDEEALRWFGTYPAFYDLAFVAPARFREGQVFERLGRSADARASFTRVIDLWHDADPSLQPLVREVRTALTRLR